MSEPEHPVPVASRTVPTVPAGSSQPDRFAEQRAALAAVHLRPLTEHADVFAALHSRLQAALAEIDGL